MTQEEVQDIIGAMVTGNTETDISVTYDDANEKLNFVVTGGGGDVVGPAGATDHAIARFDTDTGKLIQDSVVLVGDTGEITGVSTLEASGAVTVDDLLLYDTNASHTLTLHWNEDEAGANRTMNIIMGGADHTLTVADVALNTSDRHTQGTDTTLGTMTADIDMDNTYQVVNLQAPSAAGEAIRQTAKITEANMEAAHDHVASDGSSHTFIDQDVTDGAAPTFDDLLLYDTNASHTLTLHWAEDEAGANRTLNLVMGGADRTITLSGDPTLDDWFDQAVKIASSPTFAGATMTGNVDMGDNDIIGIQDLHAYDGTMNIQLSSEGTTYVKGTAGLNADTVLLLHLDGADGATSTTDSGPNAHSFTFVGDAQLDTAQKVFGTASLLLDGTGDYITTTDHGDWWFGSDDFTIETRIRFNGDPTGTDFYIMNQRTAGSSDRGWGLGFSNDHLFFSYATSTGGWTDEYNPSWNPASATWYHLAVVRDGNTIHVYVDGTEVGAGHNCTGDTLVNCGQPLWIGASPYAGGSEFLNGWLDEIRIVKGTAIWTSNFTPPTVAYGGVSNAHLDVQNNITLGGTFTDGTSSLTAGALTGLVSITDGTASWSSSALSGFTTITTTGLITGGTDLVLGDWQHSSPTYTSAHDWMNLTQSAGLLDGGLITDSGSLEIKVAAGYGFGKATHDSDGIGATRFFDWPETDNIATAAGKNTVYVDTINRTVHVTTTPSVDIDHTTKISIGSLWNDGASLHILNEAGTRLNNWARRAHRRTRELRSFERATGMVISDDTGREFTVTAGAWYAGNNRQTTTEQVSGTDFFTAVYLLNGTWTYTAHDQTAASNTQYNDVSTGGAEVLASLTAALPYGVHWHYMDIDDHLYVQYGQGAYKLADAIIAPVPTAPSFLSDYAMLVGKSIVERNQAEFVDIASYFKVSFNGTATLNHNDTGLLNTGDYLHLTAAEYGGLNMADWDAAYTHVSSDGTDHGYINQDVQTTASPTFDDLLLYDTNASHTLTLHWNEDEAGANRTFNLIMGGADRSLTLGGDIVLDAAVPGIGISDNELVAIDGADIANAEYAKFTANGLQSKTFAEVLGDLSGQADAAFAWNAQNLTGVGTIGCGAITSTGDFLTPTGAFGIARTDGTLHVHTATAGGVTAHADADDLVVENSAAGGISILTPAASNSNIYFGSPGDSAGAVVRWNLNADKMYVGTLNAGAALAFYCGNSLTALTLASTKAATFAGTTINMVVSGTTLTVGVGVNNGTVSAGIFTDRTKFFEGDALAELRGIRGVDGEIDHDTLPEFTKANVTHDIMGEVETEFDGKRVIEIDKVGEETVVERDLGATASMLTVAVQQLEARIAELERV